MNEKSATANAITFKLNSFIFVFRRNWAAAIAAENIKIDDRRHGNCIFCIKGINWAMGEEIGCIRIAAKVAIIAKKNDFLIKESNTKRVGIIPNMFINWEDER